MRRLAVVGMVIFLAFGGMIWGLQQKIEAGLPADEPCRAEGLALGVWAEANGLSFRRDGADIVVETSAKTWYRLTQAQHQAIGSAAACIAGQNGGKVRFLVGERELGAVDGQY